MKASILIDTPENESLEMLITSTRNVIARIKTELSNRKNRRQE